MSIEMSLIVGTRDREDSFRRWAKSVAATATVPTQVIVGDACDNAGPDSYVVRVCDEEFAANPKIETRIVIYEKPRQGVVKGYNTCFWRATGRYVSFLNDDAELLPGWDRTAIDFMDAHPQVGMGALYWRDPGGRWYVQTFQNMVYANFGVIRREVGEQVGWLDDREVFVPELGKKAALKFYGMDNSIALKIIDAGFAVCQIPNCKVEHYREQDDVRRQNTAEHIMSSEHDMVPGSLPGRILWLLWNGDPEMTRRFGHEYGWKQLREKYEKFKGLEGPIYID